MDRLISFSLYGDDPKYAEGLRANIDLARKHYPGWKVIVWSDNLERDCAECADRVIACGPSIDQSGMLWRLYANDLMDMDVVIFRDADSRLNEREAGAVDMWIKSGFAAHSMHDHRHHRIHPYMGGMWGVRSAQIHDMKGLVEGWISKRDNPTIRWGTDQDFLAQVIAPALSASTLHHTSYVLPWTGVTAQFDVELPDGRFVGQQFEADGTPVFPT